jgi:hypothetical protein
VLKTHLSALARFDFISSVTPTFLSARLLSPLRGQRPVKFRMSHLALAAAGKLYNFWSSEARRLVTSKLALLLRIHAFCSYFNSHRIKNFSDYVIA